MSLHKWAQSFNISGTWYFLPVIDEVLGLRVNPDYFRSGYPAAMMRFSVADEPR